MSVPNWAPKTIWTGDNLPILRGMNSASVDLIYLDPPFNSKANYAAPIGSKAAGAEFKDTWGLSDVDAEWINLIEAKHPAVYRVLLAALTDGDKSYLVYMAARLLELRRVLKPSGSIYLHCDPTMSHYLKLLMDAVFGRANFRNEIVWRRHAHSHSLGSKQWPAIYDVLLMYAGGDTWTWNTPYAPYSAEYIATSFRHKDARGRYQAYPLTGARPGGAEAYEPWKERLPSAGRAWALPRYERLPDWLDLPPKEAWQALGIHAKLDILDGLRMIHWPKKATGQPALKRYLADAPGKIMENLWTDIGTRVGASERVGYPTQKPLALLRRIIEASSNPRDLVLDPFCGCATTCVAADDLGRNWAGIDISPKAAELVVQRIAEHQGLFRDIAHRRDIPKRTDLGRLPTPRSHRNALYGQQAGNCAGCGEHFELRHLEVDHIIARAAGGTDHEENLQLLCGACNRVKGDRGMEYLRVRLQLR